MQTSRIQENKRQLGRNLTQYLLSYIGYEYEVRSILRQLSKTHCANINDWLLAKIPCGAYSGRIHLNYQNGYWVIEDLRLGQFKQYSQERIYIHQSAWMIPDCIRLIDSLDINEPGAYKIWNIRKDNPFALIQVTKQDDVNVSVITLLPDALINERGRIVRYKKVQNKFITFSQIEGNQCLTRSFTEDGIPTSDLVTYDRNPAYFARTQYGEGVSPSTYQIRHLVEGYRSETWKDGSLVMSEKFVDDGIAVETYHNNKQVKEQYQLNSSLKRYGAYRQFFSDSGKINEHVEYSAEGELLFRQVFAEDQRVLEIETLVGGFRQVISFADDRSLASIRNQALQKLSRYSRQIPTYVNHGIQCTINEDLVQIQNYQYGNLHQLSMDVQANTTQKQNALQCHLLYDAADPNYCKGFIRHDDDVIEHVHRGFRLSVYKAKPEQVIIFKEMLSERDYIAIHYDDARDMCAIHFVHYPSNISLVIKKQHTKVTHVLTKLDANLDYSPVFIPNARHGMVSFAFAHKHDQLHFTLSVINPFGMSQHKFNFTDSLIKLVVKPIANSKAAFLINIMKKLNEQRQLN